MRPSLTSLNRWTWQKANLRQTGAAAAVDIIAAPGAGKAIYVWEVEVSAASTTISVQVTDGADGATTRLIDTTLTANGGFIRTFPFEAPYRITTNTALKLTTDTGNCTVNVFYSVGA